MGVRKGCTVSRRYAARNGKCVLVVPGTWAGLFCLLTAEFLIPKGYQGRQPLAKLVGIPAFEWL